MPDQAPADRLFEVSRRQWRCLAREEAGTRNTRTSWPPGAFVRIVRARLTQ